jgi:class 3 adenylate cyclase/tetratricopeptide (TPR) repeat protein
VSGTQTTRFASPGTYTPQHLAERIISSRGALEGERKQVTVLFADLKGSMELLADRDPEEARRLLDPVLECMMEAVHRYEGTVNQVMGDGIMALFGAPLAHEDHAVRACYAALRMQEAVKQYAEEVRRSEGVLIQIRVGLNSGEVVVRSVGSDLRMDYTAVGQTTHLAARMEQLAAPGSILLAPDALQLAEGYVQVKALGPMAVKGLAESIEVYELLGAGTARSRLQATAARGLTKFVGRDAELETLRRTLELAGGGHGQIVALVGEPGVGKSRLVWEFSHSHRTQDWLVLEAGSVSYGKATSYLPVIDLLKSYCGIEMRDDARRIREKLTGKLLALDPALQPLLPPLLALLDVSVDDPTWQTLDPPQRRSRTLEAGKRLLLRESQEQPLLLVFEDLHWIDMETQALLDSLVDSLPTARLLLLVNYRPEYEHTWHRKTYYQQLRLDPLPAASAAELLGALLGADPALDGLKRLLVERTEGNPFFLEESVRTLVEAGVLTGERGAYRLARPFESTQVPATVQAVLAARIDRLAPEDKRLLQSAAVVGKDVPFALLQAIAELPEDALRQGLTRLHVAEFLYETSLFPDLEYTFKHALTYEVAYGSLLQERRRSLHARVLRGIESLYADRLGEYAELLAHHALRAETWPAAITYLRSAGLKAQARSAHHEAAGYLEQALETLPHLAESRETLALGVDLRLELRHSLFALRQVASMVDHLRQTETIATALDDPRRLGVISAYMGQYRFAVGDYPGTVECSERALALAKLSDDLGTEVEANYREGVGHYEMGDYRRALECFQASVAPLQDDLRYEQFGYPYLPYVNSRFWMGWALAELGEFREGVARLEEAAPVATAMGQFWSLADVGIGLGMLRLQQGAFEEAVSLLECAKEVCQAGGLAYLMPFVSSPLGIAYTHLGRLAEALPLLEMAVQALADIQFSGHRTAHLANLAQGYLAAGRADDADRVAGQALAVAREQRARGAEAWVRWLLGEIAARGESPRVEQAEGYYREALGLAEELGMRPLAAHCHLGRATLYQKLGRDAEAQAELTEAAELYRAMEMTLWLEKAQAALA